MTIRIRDIAQDVDLPVSTVGNILRNDSRYGVEVREKVMASASRLGYRPNILARGLKGGTTQTVGILWSLKGPHAPVELVHHIAERIHAHQYVTQISDSLFQREVMQQVLADYVQRGVDAVVVQTHPGIEIQELEKQFRQFKAVVLVPSSPSSTFTDQVIHSRREAIHAAVDHFLATGRKHPMIIVPPHPREDKIQPFLEELARRGIPLDPEPVIYHESNPPLTRLTDVVWDALEKSREKGIDFDSVLCGTDEAAVVVYKWLTLRGKQIPKDVAVIGFNDSSFSKYLMPALASINRRDDEVAEGIEKMLFERLENPELPPKKMEIAMKFICRESAG